MVPALRASALRRGRLARQAATCALVALPLLGGLALAPAASAGQIVWSVNNGIWAMNDDGSHPHELISAAAPQLAASLPSGTFTAPDIFQSGGTTVLFLGQTNSFAPSSQPQVCGADCSATYSLSNGLLTELGPPAAPAVGSAYYETEPRVTADGQEIFGSALTTGIVAGSAGTTASALVERRIAANATTTPWSNTGSETQPAAGFDGAPNPADPTQAAWVELQGCNYLFNGQTVCQYAVHAGSASNGNAPVVIYDKESVSASGKGPTSLAWSSDGTNLLMVDPFVPNTGIYEFPATGDPVTKVVTEVLAQPSGWTFGQARFAGSRIVFDAHQQVGSTTHGDIYTIPANCSVATCTFPASATNLTNAPTANSSDPAWTSATEPLAALRAPGGPSVTKVTLPSAPIRAGRRFTLQVTISAPGAIVVKVRRLHGTGKAKLIGSVSFAGKVGLNKLAIELVAGRALAAGTYTATIGVRGSTAAPRTIHLIVHR
jgi:hypothetical protein